MMSLQVRCRHRYASGFELDLAFQTDHLVTSLFGPSGGGKTSALSMVAGLLRPHQGWIKMSDHVLADTDSGFWLPPEKRHVGCVFQDHLLFPHMTVAGNLRFGQPHRQATNSQAELQRVAEVLEIDSLLNRWPRELSGGQRQRVALGRALLSRPRWLLMDEPLAALDESVKSRILNYLERIVHEFQIPTLFVSHSQSEVRRFSQWVIVVESGKVIAEGEPSQTLGQPKTLAWKRSAGPVNLLRVECIRMPDEKWYGKVGEQSIQLPMPIANVGAVAGAERETMAYVQFSPDQVILARQNVSGLSTRNHLRGVVRQIVSVEDGVYVAIDVGQVLWAHLTREAIDELKLATGDAVVAFIKTLALELV